MFRSRRGRDAPWWLIASTCIIRPVSTAFPGHQQTVGILQRCKRSTCASPSAASDVIGWHSNLAESVGESLLPRNPTVSLSRMFVRCNR
jgi:hypothetical protein